MTAAPKNHERPFWTDSDNPYPITDLAEWLAITTVLPGFCCQVVWREQTHIAYRFKNFRTRAEAAQFARAQITRLGDQLLDLGITPSQPIQHTEFAGMGGNDGR